VAEEYYHGRLDWYSMDLDPKGRLEPAPSHPARPQPLGPRRPNPRTTRSFLPMPISYEGMPNTRWWAFEDRKTNLGQVDPSTTDLGALLFLEFGLVYANDWFLLPQPLPAGTIATVKGLAVTNVFGERIWIEPSGAGSDQDWQRWAMFVVAPRSGTGRVDPSLLVLPTVPKVQEGPPREDVAFVRDEMANMVWGVETTISLPTGMPKPGAEAAKETVHFHRRLVERLLGDGTLTSTPVDYLAPIRYQVMSTVPEQWIPFIPVHVDNDNRATQLQRAAMPRILEGDPRSPAKVEPRTALLREGLDQAQAAPYYVHEVEVTRAGTRVYQAFQRSRWYGGKAVTWLGVRKQTGRGSGSSQLRFDTLEDTGVAAEE